MKKIIVCHALAAAFAAAPAMAMVESEGPEGNDSPASAQPLQIDSSGSVEVTGTLGVVSLDTAPVGDLDFYAFRGRAGDVVSVDIDFGMKPTGSSVRSVDTIVAVFGPDLVVLNQNDDAPDLDAGSASRRDSRLDSVHLPVDGVYRIGVSSFPRRFINGGGLTSTSLNATSNGSYTLIVSGVTPAIQQISIDIKPGARTIAPINPKSKGNIPVALLSSADFDALTVDKGSLTFGPTGDEQSLLRCGKGGEDVNRDGRLDLVCHFDNQAAGFDPGDEEGVVRGTRAGVAFEGRAWLKVLPVKRRE